MHGWREVEIGRSRRGVAIAAHVPDALGSEAAAGLLVAALHGEEPEALQVARRVLERVPGTRTRWAVVACANPDGVLAATRQNAAGVDLNRNFPSRSWSDAPSFTYPPGTTIRRRPYRTNRSSPGTAPGSEPEVQALLALVARLRPAPHRRRPRAARADRADVRDAARDRRCARRGVRAAGAPRDRLADPGARCATGARTPAGPASRTRSSTRRSRPCSGATCRRSRASSSTAPRRRTPATGRRPSRSATTA